jgi:bifunctional non-homologous end joining protein LigD
VLDPMLAVNRAPDAGHPWAIEPKLDGWRAVVTIDGRVRVRTRRGRDVSASLPELALLADHVPDGTVLDGELVAGKGRSTDFYSIGPSMMARRRQAPLCFVAFDVPFVVGESTTELAYRDRRRLLEALEFEGPAWCTVASFEAVVEDVLTECERLNLEGLVAKRLDSRYEPGKRSMHWRKVKCSSWRERHAPLRHER